MESAHRALIPAPAAEAAEFVRFCYRRRRSGWPELYDEMCAVAGRGLFQGWGPDELAQVGIGLSLFELPALAALAAEVIAQETGEARTASARRGSPEPAVETSAGGSIRSIGATGSGEAPGGGGVCQASDGEETKPHRGIAAGVAQAVA